MSQKTSSDDTNTPSPPHWRPDQPYNQLPCLPPDTAELETKDVLRRCIRARAALGELKQAAELIPNQGILISTLPLLEAQASSEIENIVTTNDRLFQLQGIEDGADPATKEALRYRHALLEGYRSLSDGPLTTHTAETICSRIKGTPMQVRDMPGTTLQNPALQKVIYTPPQDENTLRELLENWQQFMNQETDLDPLVRMAVAHYQFEAIHPFTDGNGRTGRVLNSLLLIQDGLLTLPVLYLSRYIIATKRAYYERLLAVTTQHAWEPWVMYILYGIEETATWTLQKIKAIRTLFDATTAHVRQAQPKVYSHELINLIFEQPYCRIQNLVEAGLVGRQAASRHLKDLVDAGVLVEQKVGREKLFLNTKLLKLLTTDENNVAAFVSIPPPKT